MEHYEYDPESHKDISDKELKEVIQQSSRNLDSEIAIKAMTGAIGIYMERLQEKYSYPPIFPFELIPIEKNKLKEWGVKYASLNIKSNGKLLKYQEDAALSYLKFRDITNEQWESIWKDSVENLGIYAAEIKEWGISDKLVLQEYKEIVDSYYDDLNLGVKELHLYLSRETNQNKRNSTLVISLIILLGLIVLAGILSNF